MTKMFPLFGLTLFLARPAFVAEAAEETTSQRAGFGGGLPTSRNPVDIGNQLSQEEKCRDERTCR